MDICSLEQISECVYSGYRSGGKVIVKFAKVGAVDPQCPLASRYGQLLNELDILSGPLKGCAGVPSVVDHCLMEVYLMVVTQPAGHCTLREYKIPANEERGEVLMRLLDETVAILQDVHSRGVLHRDIKPENIILIGRNNQVGIIDFGLAIRKCDRLKRHVTSLRVGTPAYASRSFEQSVPSESFDDFEMLAFSFHGLFIGIGRWLEVVSSGTKPTFDQLCEEHDEFALRLSKLREPSSVPSKHTMALFLAGLVGSFLALYISQSPGEPM